jgi:hypothetical protein
MELVFLAAGAAVGFCDSLAMDEKQRRQCT